MGTWKLRCTMSGGGRPAVQCPCSVEQLGKFR